MAKIVKKMKNTDRVYLTLARKDAEKRRQGARHANRTMKIASTVISLAHKAA